MSTITLPSEADISQTITLIRNRFKNPAIEKPVNKSVHAGYRQAIVVLAEGITDYDKAGLEQIDTVQARAIVVMACDYLRGEATQQALVNVPLKA